MDAIYQSMGGMASVFRTSRELNMELSINVPEKSQTTLKVVRGA